MRYLIAMHVVSAQKYFNIIDIIDMHISAGCAARHHRGI